MVQPTCKLLLLNCIILFFTFTVNATTESKRNSLIGFGVGARANVLKATYISIADDYSTTQWNPAGITFIDGISIGGMYSKMPLNREINFVSLILPLSQHENLGFSIGRFLINNIPARRRNTITPDYYFQNIEETIWLTYSRIFFSRLSFGINFKYLHQALNGIDAGGWGIDCGLIVVISPKIKLGVAVYDFGSQLKWPGGHIDNFTKLNRFGISYQAKPDLLLSLALEGNNKKFNQLALGTEFMLRDPLFIRMGWQNNLLSLGTELMFCFKNIDLKLNYAITSNKLSNELSDICDVNISFRKPSNKPQFVIINCNTLNVRKGPGVKKKKITEVYKDQKFILKAKKSKWLKIEYCKNKTGWIKSSYAKVVNN